MTAPKSVLAEVLAILGSHERCNAGAYFQCNFCEDRETWKAAVEEARGLLEHALDFGTCDKACCVDQDQAEVRQRVRAALGRK